MPGLGDFFLKKHREGNYYSPITGQHGIVPARTRIKFAPEKALKREVE